MTESEIWGETETDNTERAETDNTGRVETDNTGRAFLASGAVAEQVWESQAASIAVPRQDRKITDGLHSSDRAGLGITDGLHSRDRT